MDVTPQLLHDVEFREAKRGGYNTQDVDEFLERLAIGLERQETVVQEAQQRVAAAEARAEEAERRAAHAEHAASETTASDETLKRTLVLAQRTADAAIREAEEQAERTLSAAHAEAERLLSETHEAHAQAQAQAEAEARAAHEKARTQVLGEMRDLVAARDRLREDLNLLEHHLEGQRERVRVTIEELQRLLDDPDALYEVEAPELSEAPVPFAEEPVVPAWSDDDPAMGESDDEWTDDAWPDVTDAEELDAEDVDDDGSDTQPVEVVEGSHPDDDAYLTELRKAMTDDTPLGPRDDIADASRFDTTVEPERSRFGRRR